jgi:small-conductance mechanosensitive channel
VRELFDRASEVLSTAPVQSIGKALLVVLLGLLIAKLVNRRLRQGSLQSQTRLLVRRFLTGFILVVTVAWALSLAGVDVSVLLGTAGFLTIAVGFAAQTSVSNLISGVFLMAEKPFKIGDVIDVSGTRGEVIIIDLMSVKLRTFDNLLVRIPNEMMLKASVTNTTYFEIRRYDLQIGVAYKEDVERVRAILLEVAETNLLCLRDPKAQVIFIGFGDSAVNLQFSVWAKRESFLDLRNSIAEDVKRVFDEKGIEIPFPHRTLYAGSATGPLPVQVVASPPAK